MLLLTSAQRQERNVVCLAGCHFETCSDTLFWAAKAVAANELFSSHTVPSFSGLAIVIFCPYISSTFFCCFCFDKARLRLFHHSWPLLSKLFWSWAGGAFVCEGKRGGHCDNVWTYWTADLEWVTVSEALSWKCLRLGRYYSLYAFGHRYSLYALLREEMRGTPLACSVTGSYPWFSDIWGSCREYRNSLHVTLRERGGRRANLIMRYSTKAVCGRSASAAQETLLLSGPGHGSDSLCLENFYGWKFVWRILSAPGLHKWWDLTHVSSHQNPRTEASPC